MNDSTIEPTHFICPDGDLVPMFQVEHICINRKKSWIGADAYEITASMRDGDECFSWHRKTLAGAIECRDRLIKIFSSQVVLAPTTTPSTI